MSSVTLATLADAAGIPSGTSFPVSPATNDLFRRTDYGIAFYYDGTRWLSLNLYYTRLELKSGLFQISATQADYSRGPTTRNVGSDIYLISSLCTFFVFAGGTALSGSHKWVGTLYKTDTSNVKTTLITVTIDSGSSAAWRQDAQNINAVLGTAATYPTLTSTWTKTGTPGDFGAYVEFSYRIVAT